MTSKDASASIFVDFHLVHNNERILHQEIEEIDIVYQHAWKIDHGILKIARWVGKKAKYRLPKILFDENRMPQRKNED